MLSLSREEYRRLAASGGPVPLTRDFVADVETPLSAYWKIARDEPFSFLLESVTGGEHLARYSVIGSRPRKVLTCRGMVLTVTDESGSREEILPFGADPLAKVRDELKPIPAERLQGLPKFCGGAVGFLAYDYARRLEKLPGGPKDDLNLPEMAMMAVDRVVVFDHVKNALRYIAIADGSDDAYDAVLQDSERIRGLLRQPMPALPVCDSGAHPVTANTEKAKFEDSVRRIKQYIAQGDCIQAVPSLRFETQVEAHPISVYRALRSLNPSPYMFLLRLGECDVVGASPELLVGLAGREARVRPIAGTRPRGATGPEDEQLAAEKERAEHIMLVDLGRNDVGRVSDYGTVAVGDLMVIERYSHVMHIVSHVTGRLREGLDGIDLVRATFPAGTVSGAPKVRAMEIIDELEPTRRGLYAGAVGYFSDSGDVDLAIAIRTILMKGGKAYVQAGAGIVHDSDPAREYEECVNKARASLRAIEMAQTGFGGT
jgi:anthranilate synthase component 1